MGNLLPEIKILPIRAAMEKLGFVRFAALFGSYLNVDNNYSDVDLLVICKEDNERKTIYSEMSKLSYRMGHVIHLNDYLIDEFERCMWYHDYKLASILENALILIGDENYSERLNYLRRVDEKSIAFNEAIGVKILNRALENLKNFQDCIALSLHNPEYSWRGRYFQSLCIRDSHLALGYLLASQKMKETGTITTLRKLLSEEPLIKKLISVDKRIKRRGNISPIETEENVLKVRSEYANYNLK